MENNKDTVDVVNPRNKTPRIQSTKGSTRSKVECMVATEKDKISSGSRERKKPCTVLKPFFPCLWRIISTSEQ